jgi:hypothetical protein
LPRFIGAKQSSVQQKGGQQAEEKGIPNLKPRTGNFKSQYLNPKQYQMVKIQMTESF